MKYHQDTLLSSSSGPQAFLFIHCRPFSWLETWRTRILANHVLISLLTHVDSLSSRFTFSSVESDNLGIFPILISYPHRAFGHLVQIFSLDIDGLFEYFTGFGFSLNDFLSCFKALFLAEHCTSLKFNTQT